MSFLMKRSDRRYLVVGSVNVLETNARERRCEGDDSELLPMAFGVLARPVLR